MGCKRRRKQKSKNGRKKYRKADVYERLERGDFMVAGRRRTRRELNRSKLWPKINLPRLFRWFD